MEKGYNLTNKKAENATADIPGFKKIQYADFERQGEITFFDLTANPLRCSHCGINFIVLFNEEKMAMHCPRCGAERKTDLKEESE